jgi:hypothetical protein
VFTARYELSPYIKPTRFVFKGLNVSKATIIMIIIILVNLLITCVTSERENEHAAKDVAETCRLTRTGNEAALNGNVSRTPVQVFKTRVLWVVAPFGWTVAIQRFRGTYRLHLQRNESVN